MEKVSVHAAMSSSLSTVAKIEAPDMAFTRTTASSLLHRVRHGISSVELVYAPHDKWPIPHPRFTPLVHRPLRILVLDSSYNPPTLAHLALANSRRPFYSLHPHTASCNNAMDCDALDYDAKLLLLSVRNADKTLRAGDASYLQRLEMMTLLAKNVGHEVSPNESYDRTISPEEGENVAVAIIDEPTFVKKSSILRAFLWNKFAAFASTKVPFPTYETQLTFLLGFDTLERVISPRYYPSEAEMLSSFRVFFSSDGDDSRVVCARRSSDAGFSAVDESSEKEKLALVQEFISSERIVLIDIKADVRTYSSSAVRDTIARIGVDSDEWKKFVPRAIAEYVVNEKLFTV
jgi:nicotinamide-nucleotide adenylyltransferase